MRTGKSDSMVQKALKSLCRCYGWSYGVFWRFDQRNSLLLTVEDAYYEEQTGAFIDNMLLQVHMLGNGVVGQAAFTRRHRWIFSDAHCGGENPVGSIENQDIFQDDSEIHCQFSSGIETIALISVEPRGVVQFGSTQKIPQRMEFVDQTKRLFLEIENDDTFILPENMPSSSNSESYGLSGLLASSIPSGNLFLENWQPMHMGTTCSSTDPPQLSPLTSDHGRMNSSHLGNQLQKACTEAPFKLSNKSNTWLQEPLVQSTTYFNHAAAPSPCISTCSGHSTLTSIEQQLPCQTRFLGSQTLSLANLNSLTPCRNAVQNFEDPTFTSVQSTGGLVDIENRSTSPGTFEELFQADDFTTALSKSCPLDNCFPRIVPPTEKSNNTLATPLRQNPSQGMEVSSVSASLNGAEVLINIPVNHLSNSVQSSITNTFNSDGDKKFLYNSGVENDLFDGLGVDFECGQAENFLDDILMPVVSGGFLDFSAETSECISEQCVGSTVGPQETLFSKLGLEQFLDGIAGSSNSIASSSCSVSGDYVQLTSLPCFGGKMNSLQSIHNLDRSHNLEPKKEVIPKSEIGSWIGDSYSITCGSSAVSQPKRSEESVKVGRKRARPGSRPKPKDRQQIQERIAELRKLIPNGVKMSIDSLLAQTIKHMLFLQNVTKHAEKLKQAEERMENEAVLRDDSSSSGFNAMWACEVGAQTMVDPVDVKNLSLPGQKLIEMLCEEKGFFLEIVDIIQGFGLTILKGVMEVRQNKIWASFIVEAQANRHVTKQEIYVSLHQLLYQKATSEINGIDEVVNVLSGGTTLFNNYHQPLVPFPISLAETLL